MSSRFQSGAISPTPASADVWSKPRSPVKPGAKVEIGLWVPNGKIWVKGFVLSGVVSRTGPANGVRVHFEGMAPTERDNLRQFLKFVQDTTKASQTENGYLNLLK